MVFQYDLIREIELLRGKDTIPEAHVLLSLDLHRCQLKAKEELRQEQAVQSLSLLRKRTSGDHHLPALDVGLFAHQGHALEALFGCLCDILVQHDRWDPVQTESFQNAVNRRSPELSLIIRKSALADRVFFETLSEEVGIAQDGLLFAGFQTGRPFFELLAEDIREAEECTSWAGAVCPVCGHEPDMAKLERESGRRILHCPLCDTEWNFRRLHCPFCLTDNQDALRFFYTDVESPYRVDVCDACGRYIKTVDERKLAEGRTVLFAVEDVATILLDVAAWKEGFRQPGLHVPELRDTGVL